MTNPQANLGDPITPSLGYYFLGLWGVEVKKCVFDWFPVQRYLNHLGPQVADLDPLLNRGYHL